MNENGGDTGGSPGGKPWERSWSTDEMRQNAHSWNLAGDAGLLKHLQEFSQVTVFLSLMAFIASLQNSF